MKFIIAALFFLHITVAQDEIYDVEAVRQANSQYQTAYFASGCFWCVESIFESLEGVSEAISGYAGGQIDTPSYRLVANGLTMHAEAVEVFYDPSVISFKQLVDVFFGSHDPTTLNSQGPDVGAHYRSIAFYKNEDEERIIRAKIYQLEKNKVFEDPIVTQVTRIRKFFTAEVYHQDYKKKNPFDRYIIFVSMPRLNRFKSKFPELLKKGD